MALSVSGAASAQQGAPPEPPGAAAPAPTPEATWQEPERRGYVHDGFYLRLGVGAAYVRHAIDSDQAEARASVGGGGVAIEIAAGGTIAPGLVLGGGFFGQVLPSSSGSDAKIRERRGDAELESSSFGLFGLLADWYPNPERGLHVQGAVGLASLQSGRGELASRAFSASHNAAGLGLMVGAGYEWWVAEEWSVGVLGRVSFGALAGEDEAKNEWSHSVVAPALLFGATYH